MTFVRKSWKSLWNWQKWKIIIMTSLCHYVDRKTLDFQEFLGDFVKRQGISLNFFRNSYNESKRPKRNLFLLLQRNFLKYFLKFVHTGNFREVTGLNLLSNVFNFCWLTLVSEPRTSFFRLSTFVNFLQKSSIFSSWIIIQGSIMTRFTL